MRIEQALYGEARGGHALWAASGDTKIPTELTSRLDLPDTAPPGIEWSPFLSGFPHDEHYILARTIRDEASLRAGMVFSHALIVPAAEIVRANDLRPLIALLSTSPVRVDSIDPVTLSDSLTSKPELPLELAVLAQALVTRGVGPVVRLGHVDFDALVVALWAQLWPNIRRGFAFRLSFGPNDLVESPSPALVCTPSALAARWTGFRVVRNSDQHDAYSLGASVLSGGQDGWPLLQFARDVGAELSTFFDLPLAEQAYRLGAGTGKRFEDIVAAARLVERLSPNSAAGKSGKIELLQKLAHLVSTATAKQVLQLRNLRLGVSDTSHPLWPSVSRWAAENPYLPHEDVDMVSLIESATSAAGAVAEWQQAALNGLSTAVRGPQAPILDAFWRWAEVRSEIVANVFDQLPRDRELEKRITRAAPPTLTTSVADTVMTLSRSRKWFLLHGAAASAGYEPMKAVRRQLSVDSNASHLDGLREALRRATPAQVLLCALELEEPRLLKLASEAVAATPSLLAGVDVCRSSSQSIWAQAIASNPRAWEVPHAKAAFHALLDAVVDGCHVNLSLIEQLSRSPLADLSDFARRAEVWDSLDITRRASLLAATAAGWLHRFADGAAISPPEPELQAAMLTSPKLKDVMESFIPHRIGLATRFVAVLDQFGEARFMQWLHEAVSRVTLFDASDAEALGRVILSRRWNRVADELVRLDAAGRTDVRPALRVCYSLLGLWNRLTLGLAPLSSTEKWELLETTAVELYPSGPDHEELWERAGGVNADLQHRGNGRTRWHQVLSEIRRGKTMRAEELICAMRHDYPYNDQLRYLADDHEFGGKRFNY